MNNLKRLNEILRILKTNDLINNITPDKLCNTLEELGPTFIKLGQIMSTRVDLIPMEYCKALSKLRSKAIPMPYQEIEEILKQNYDNLDEIFISIDETPIGSASIAQVHKAILKENRKEVILKIKRPRIEEILESDITLFKKAISTLHLNKLIKVINLNDALDQLLKTTKEETNFQTETNHLIQFRNNHYEHVKCPYVYKRLCTNDVIVMEYINGLKINDIKALKENHYNLTSIANLLCKNYIDQALETGLFHADPHPDNIFIEGDDIVYIDLGMMGRLTDRNKNNLKKCLRAIALKDYKEVSRILINMSTPLDEINYINLENDVTNILEEYTNLDLEKINITKFSTNMFKMLQNNHLKLDENITMLIRGIVVIEAVIEELDPSISLFKVIILSQNYNLDNLLNIDTLKEKGQQIIKNINNLTEIPTQLATLLKSLNKEECKIKVELNNSPKQVDKLENLIHELILGFLDGCLIIASVLVQNTGMKSIFTFFTIIITTILIIKMLHDTLHRGY